MFTIGERGGTTRKSDRIGAVSLTTGKTNMLVAGASPTLMADRYLVYVVGGVLWAVRFDADRLAITGDAAPVAGKVLYNWDAHYSISRDGTLVYFPDWLEFDRELVWVDQSGNVESLNIEPRPYFRPRLSPDGQTIAVVVSEEASPDLFLFSIARGTFTRLTYDESLETNPLWTPDGQYLIYSSNRIDNLFRVNATGVTVVERLTESEHFQFPGAISPDGRQIFFSERGMDSRSFDISVLTLSDVPTTEVLLQSDFTELWPALSPDGRWLAYVSERSGQEEVYLQPYPDVEAGRWQVSVGGGVKALWHPSGERLFYSGPTHMMSVTIETDDGLRIGTPDRLFAIADYHHDDMFGFDWDPKTERFLMVKRTSKEEGPPSQLVIVQNWLEFVAAELEQL